MNCYLCEIFLPSEKFFSKHFRLMHNKKENSVYKCTFDNCEQYVAKLQHFKKHFQNHISESQQQLNTSLNVEPARITLEVSPNSPSNTQPPTSSDSEDSSAVVDEYDNPDLSLSISKAASVKSPSNGGMQFSLWCHSKSNFTKKDVSDIRKNVLNNIVSPIMNEIDKFVTENNLKENLSSKLNVLDLQTEISEVFKNCNDYKIKKWSQSRDLINNFTEFTINKELEEVVFRGEVTFKEKNVTGVLMPISFQIRKLFEKSDTLLTVLEGNGQGPMPETNFMNSALWKEKSAIFSDSNKIALPIFLYMDDSEINNALGSHCDPVCFVYYSFPAIKNCDIFVASFIKSKDFKKYGNEKCLYVLLKELKKLEEEGIEIKTSKGVKTVHFVLGLIIGDNLALNSILGFTTSFNHSHFCRFCKMSKLSSGKENQLDRSLLRTKCNYNEDILCNNLRLTGVQSECIFHNIRSFHCTTNYSVDIMHDIFEGVCHYNLCHIIKYFIEKKFFTLECLNHRKLFFNYGEKESGNKSPEININHLNKCHLKMSASEMMTFVHLFPLMVGDLIPHDDEIWLFFLQFLEIIEILLLYNISQDLLYHLDNLIKCNLRDYVTYFEDNLKPKHHFMLHYKDVIHYSGPPRFYWSFRYESKHRDFKVYAKVNNCRKNICVSFAKKYELQFASFLVNDFEANYEVKSYHIIPSKFQNDIEQFCKSYPNEEYECYSKCKFDSKTFRCGNFIVQYFDPHIEYAKIYKIEEILVFSNLNKVFLICSSIRIIKYENHFRAFEIDSSDTLQSDTIILLIDHIAGPPITSHKTSQGKTLIRPKQF